MRICESAIGTHDRVDLVGSLVLYFIIKTEPFLGLLANLMKRVDSSRLEINMVHLACDIVPQQMIAGAVTSLG